MGVQGLEQTTYTTLHHTISGAIAQTGLDIYSNPFVVTFCLLDDFFPSALFRHAHDPSICFRFRHLGSAGGFNRVFPFPTLFPAARSPQPARSRRPESPAITRRPRWTRATQPY